jgi:carboxymethylenebutenolidase
VAYANISRDESSEVTSGSLASRAGLPSNAVVELVLSFTHETQWDYLLPGIPPTGKHVDLPHVVVMKFENGKVAHERLYWDQASLLVQVGLLDPTNLPVAGAEQAGQLQRVAQGRAHAGQN